MWLLSVFFPHSIWSRYLHCKLPEAETVSHLIVPSVQLKFKWHLTIMPRSWCNLLPWGLGRHQKGAHHLQYISCLELYSLVFCNWLKKYTRGASFKERHRSPVLQGLIPVLRQISKRNQGVTLLLRTSGKTYKCLVSKLAGHKNTMGIDYCWLQQWFTAQTIVQPLEEKFLTLCLSTLLLSKVCALSKEN